MLFFKVADTFFDQIEDLAAHGAPLIGRYGLDLVVEFPVHADTQMLSFPHDPLILPLGDE